MHPYNGFIYLWFDSYSRMFYLGSHYGTIDDGYIGSGVRFNRAYKIRPDKFKRRIIEFVQGTKQYIFEREQSWLNLIKDSELNIKYYNMKKTAIGGCISGRKDTPEQLIRKREVRLGKTHSDATLQKMSASWETRQYKSEESKLNFQNKRLGKTHSDETKQLIREQKLGKPGHPLTKETIQKMKITREANEQLKIAAGLPIRKPETKETRLKKSQSHIGKKQSDETKQKVQETRKRNAEARKQLTFDNSVVAEQLN